MAVTTILEIFILVLSLNRVNAKSEYNNTCAYKLIEADKKLSSDSSYEVVLSYIIWNNQSECIMNVDEIYKNLTKHVTVDITNLYSGVNFHCIDNGDIHLLSSETNRKIDKLDVFFDLSITFCSVYMEELANFQQFGYIFSITTNETYIHPGASCSSLKNLRELSSSLMCTENYKNETSLRKRKSFFWEECDPFNQLTELNLQGCRKDMYNIDSYFVQSKFPKLQQLRLKYTNLTLNEMTFPWTNEFLNIPDLDSIKPITFYTKSEKYGSYSMKRIIAIHDSIVKFSNDVTLVGYISEIVINENKMPKLTDTIFMKVRDLIVLDLSYNEIKEVDRHAFIMQTKLETLILANNNLTTLPLDVFDNLSYLLNLDLSSNRITKVEQRYFKHLTKLENLNLERNSIITLPFDFLEAQINSVQSVFLSENPLETFPLNVLHAPKIQFVGLHRCHINFNGLQSLLNSSISYESMSQTDLLKPFKPILDLSQNNITKISFKNGLDSDVFRLLALSEIFILNLKDNPIDCTCLSFVLYTHGIDIDWKCQYPSELKGRLLTTIKPQEIYCPIYSHSCPDKCACFKRNYTNTLMIDCRNINMTSLPSVMPAGRLEMWFRNSSLLEISPRDYMENITFLDVSHNRINQITTVTAKALGNVSTLKLDYNNLTHLPEQFATMNMSKVTLLGNPFVCDCKMKWMKSWLLIRTKPVEQWNKIECKYNTSNFGKLILLPDSVLVCKTNLHLHEHVVFPSVTTGSVLFILVCIFLLTVKRLLHVLSDRAGGKTKMVA